MVLSGKAIVVSADSIAKLEKLHAKIGQVLMGRDFLHDTSIRLGMIRGGK